MPSYDNHSGHILMIPYPASGHILPHIDLTHQLLLRGLTVTILVTPKNLHYLNPLLSLHSSHHRNVKALVLPFPPHSSIPPGVENMKDVPISFVPDFAAALSKLRDPLVEWFQTHPSPPIAIVSDMLLCSWTPSLASYLNIPNICFVVTNAHAVSSWWVNDLEHMPDCYRELHLGCIRSWGLVFNSFIEIDKEKLKLIEEELTKHDRLWAVGPLLPIKGKSERGGKSSMPQEEIMAWLDSCHVDKSVVYVGFGTQITLNKEQMEAVASALEESRVGFIWAVKEPMIKGGVEGVEDEDDQNVVPKWFEDRTAGRGLVIRGWAPQLAILGHRAVGSYLTHCGWNSALESILAGVVLLAWPMQADHFHNTNMLVDEFGVGIRVCEGLETIPDSTKLGRTMSESLSMTLPERVRAMKVRKTALDAIREGGSSYKALDGLVGKLSSLKCSNNIHQ